MAVPYLGGACAVGDGCVRGFLMYSDRDMVGMPMAWYFRKAFEKVFMALCCSLLVCMCYSGNLSSCSGMILIILGRGVLAGRASLCSGLKPLRQKQSRYAYFIDRLRHRARTYQQPWRESGGEPGSAVVSELYSFRPLSLLDTHPGLAVVTH